MSFDRLLTAVSEMKNPSVVGMDPCLDYIPAYLREETFATYEEPFEAAAQAFLRFGCAIIDAVCDVVPALKPQSAYYEVLGWQGVRALQETIAYAQKKGMFVIVDGKRNDIGSTMAAYAHAYLGTTNIEGRDLSAFGADALTVNGYLGSDCIQPLQECCATYDKGIFVLAKTSNPSSGELQDRCCPDVPVYRHMGELCETWGASSRGRYGYSAVGAVVGATYPAQLRELRAALPHTLFLVPGYGAQGGCAQDIAGAFDRDGLGAIVNSSRAVLTAWQKENGDPHDFAQAARREVLRMRNALTGRVL